jgi:hypothetical protein
MNPWLIGIVIGLVIGTPFGMAVMSLLVSASERDAEFERSKRRG